MNDMRKLMETVASAADLYSEFSEDFTTEPERADPFNSPEDAFRDEMPAHPLTITATREVPMLYMRPGDELYLEPSNNQGELYSEENGLAYDWDLIFDLAQRGMIEIQVGGDEPEMVPYEEGLEEGDDIVEAEGDVDQVFGNLQRELTSVAMKAQQAASFIKRMHPEEREKYNLATDIEMELDILRKRVFDAR